MARITIVSVLTKSSEGIRALTANVIIKLWWDFARQSCTTIPLQHHQLLTIKLICYFRLVLIFINYNNSQKLYLQHTHSWAKGGKPLFWGKALCVMPLLWKKGGRGSKDTVGYGAWWSWIFCFVLTGSCTQQSSSNQAKKAIYSYIACLEYYLQLKDEGIGILYIISLFAMQA